MNTRKKYIFEGGVMKLNPHYVDEQKVTKNDPVNKESLAVLASTDDVKKAQADLGQKVVLSEATVSAMEIVQDDSYLSSFGGGVDGGDILDGISKYFARYEVPIGLLNKVLALTEYALNFVVDDSGSMNEPSDVVLSDATQFIKDRYRTQTGDGRHITRWQEAEDRIHILLDMLSYIPTNEIKIRFLNKTDLVTLDRKSESPEEFQKRAHAKVREVFNKTPVGLTPMKKTLVNILDVKGQTVPTMHYIFTDGEPSDGSTDELKQIVKGRTNPKNNPINFMSCTNDGDQAEWMKQVEGDADFVSEIDDFISERKEVLDKQGPAFPFTRGFWLLCQLCAPINPDDLDALDEEKPFSKKTLDNLMGRKLTPQEYSHYFKNNPYSKNYRENEFMSETLSAAEILKNKGKSGGFFSSSTSSQTSEPSRSLFSYSR